MNNVPEGRIERQRYVYRQLKLTGMWQNAGMKAYYVLLILFMGSLALLLAHSSRTSPARKNYSRTTGKVLESGAFVVIATPFIGTFIGYVVSRRRLRRLVMELNQEGVLLHHLVSPMAHEKDKEVKSAAKAYLILLKKNGIALPASETLVRASTPSTSTPDTLLRGAMDNNAIPPEQLLRATTEQAKK